MHNRCFFRCLHSVDSSFLLFSVAISGLHIMKYFSFRQRLHVLLDDEYDLALAINFHFKSYVMFWSFSVQMWWLRVVEFLLFSSLKLFVCPLNLVLKVFSVKCPGVLGEGSYR